MAGRHFLVLFQPLFSLLVASNGTVDVSPKALHD